MFRLRSLMLTLLLCTLLACDDTGASDSERADGDGPSLGTPTPDLPDFLEGPQPDDILLNVSAEVETLGEVGSQSAEPTSEVFGAGDDRWQVTDTRIAAGPGSVPDNARLWVLNLDDDSPPIEGMANTDGSFETRIAVVDGDRVRIHTRTDLAHSAALDLVARIPEDDPQAGRFVAAADEALDCLGLKPAKELRLASMDAFTLRNDCSGPVNLTARLRLSNAGFTLGTVPASIEAGSSAALEVRHQSGSASEQVDVLLLEVNSAGQSGRYSPGVWSIPTTDGP